MTPVSDSDLQIRERDSESTESEKERERGMIEAAEREEERLELSSKEVRKPFGLCGSLWSEHL